MSNANIYRFEGPNSLWKGAKYLLGLVAEGLSAALAISGEDDPLVAALLSAESGIPPDSLLTGNVPSRPHPTAGRTRPSKQPGGRRS